MTEYTVEVKNGSAIITLPSTISEKTGKLTVGTHNVTANYPKSDKYKQSTATSTITIIKDQPTITEISSTDFYASKQGTITVQLKSGKNIPFSNMTVELRDETGFICSTTTNSEGKVTLPYTPAVSGQKTIVIQAFGSDNNYYNNTTLTKTITVNKLTPILNTPALQYFEQGITFNLESQLTKQDGTPISGQTIYFETTDGKTVATGVTNDDGYVYASFNKATKTRENINAVYRGNDIYSSVTNTFTIYTSTKVTCDFESTGLISNDSSNLEKNSNGLLLKGTNIWDRVYWNTPEPTDNCKVTVKYIQPTQGKYGIALIPATNYNVSNYFDNIGAARINSENLNRWYFMYNGMHYSGSYGGHVQGQQTTATFTINTDKIIIEQEGRSFTVDANNGVNVANNYKTYRLAVVAAENFQINEISIEYY